MKNVQSISKLAAGRMTLALSAALASPTIAALTPIPVTTSLTTEDFDSLGTTASTLMPGSWKWGYNSSSGMLGSYTGGHQTVDYAAGGGAVFATQGSYNFGAGNDATGSDRAIGCLTGSLYKDFTVYGYFQTPVVLPSFYVSYDIEKYRAGAYAGARVQMYFSLNGSSWTSAGSDFQTMYAADAASAVYVPAPGSTTTVSGVYTPSASIARNATFYVALNIAITSGSGTGNGQALGFDNFAISQVAHTTLVPEPAGLGVVGSLMWAASRRRRRATTGDSR